MVDRNKSWSTEELNKKISECDEEIFKAECDAGKARVKMLNPMANHAALESYIRNAHKAKANARSKKRKYQKKLRNLDVFNSSSATIFANVHKLSVAVGKGASVVKGAKTFAIPHKDDLKWTKVKAKADTFHIVEPKEHTNYIEGFIKIVGKIGSYYHDIKVKLGYNLTGLSKIADDVLDFARFADVEEAIKSVLGATKVFSKAVPYVGFGLIVLDGLNEYRERRDKGESIWTSLERTCVSEGAQYVCGTGGALLGMAINAPLGMATGTVATLPIGGVEGGAAGFALGGVAGAVYGNYEGMKFAKSEFDSDIDGK